MRSGGCELLKAILDFRAIAPETAHDSEVEFRKIASDRGAFALEFIDAFLERWRIQANRAPSVGPFRDSLQCVFIEAADQHRRPRFLRRFGIALNRRKLDVLALE